MQYIQHTICIYCTLFFLSSCIGNNSTKLTNDAISVNKEYIVRTDRELSTNYKLAQPIISFNPNRTDKISWWVEKNGSIDDFHPLMIWCKKIFNRVVESADKRANRYPRLFILKGHNNSISICLKDGSVILFQSNLEKWIDYEITQQSYNNISKYEKIPLKILNKIESLVNTQFDQEFDFFGALESTIGKDHAALYKFQILKHTNIVFSGLSKQEHVVESCLAFIIGHELAHLALDDFWDKILCNKKVEKHDISMINMLSNIKKAKKLLNQNDIKLKEYRADSYGLIYASMAGYNIRAILNKEVSIFIDDRANQKNENMTCLTSNNTHPSSDDRIALLNFNTNEILKYVDIFNIGVRLYQLGRYQDALNCLNFFNEYYPGKEVYNNIGLIYYQMAIEELIKSDQPKAFDYMFSTMVDTDTRANKMKPVTKRGNEYIIDLINNAIRYFKMACDKDYKYLPSKINLSSAYIIAEYINLGLMTGSYSEAEGILQKIQSGYINNPLVLNNRAIALYLIGQTLQVDMFTQSENLLKRAIKENPQFSNSYYNIARLYLERKRNTTAKEYFKKFLKYKPVGLYSSIAKKYADINESKLLNTKNQIPNFIKKFLTIPLKEIDKNMQDYLDKLDGNDLKIGTMNIKYYKGNKKLIFVLKNIVEFYELDISNENQMFQYSSIQNIKHKTFSNLSGVTTHVTDHIAFDVKDGIITKFVYFE